MTLSSRSCIVALIPTKNRPIELVRAFSSINTQTVKPQLLIIVGQNDSDFEALRQLNPDFETLMPTTLLLNIRTRNLSGGINTGLMHLLNNNFDYERTYVALLDDDDTWEPEYLHKCITLAQEQDLDWVVAGITRHESKDGGIDLAIPNQVQASTFFSTNPHIQGSNLFIRLSSLLRAGCFDENLQSTTDRDLCIRLLQVGNTRVGFITEHLVHHMATGHDRLSTPGSAAKRNGLIAFYQKFNLIMSTEDRERFLERAITLFGCTRSDFAAERCPN